MKSDPSYLIPKRMGLGNFRYRLIVLFCFALVIWQSVRYWPPAFLYGDESPQYSAAKSQMGQDLREGTKGESKKEIQKVLIGVYYEALCPDSRNFIAKQLVPTFQKITDNVQVELIPYGKAKTIRTSDGYEFSCQHGPLECEANIIHACVIEMVTDPEIQLKYITCMIQDNSQPENIMNQCAVKLNIDVEPIEKCSKGTTGKELLAKYGEMTNSLSPRVTFIPTISLDGDASKLPAILKNLLKEVCLKLKNPPAGCT